jgi:hypothetical protein
MNDELTGFSRKRGNVSGDDLLPKLILAYLKKFHYPYGALRFITAFTSAHYQIIS